MDIIQIVLFGVIATFISNLVGEYNDKYRRYIRLVATLIILTATLTQFGAVIELIRELGRKINMEQGYIGLILKIIGIAYVTEFGHQLCKDGGEEAIGKKIEFAGRIMIFVIASPILLALIELITELL